MLRTQPTTRYARLGRLALTLLLALFTLPAIAAPVPVARAAPPAPRGPVPDRHGRLGKPSWQTTGTNTATFHAVVGSA